MLLCGFNHHKTHIRVHTLQGFCGCILIWCGRTSGLLSFNLARLEVTLSPLTDFTALIFSEHAATLWAFTSAVLWGSWSGRQMQLFKLFYQLLIQHVRPDGPYMHGLCKLCKKQLEGQMPNKSLTAAGCQCGNTSTINSAHTENGKANKMPTHYRLLNSLTWHKLNPFTHDDALSKAVTA